MKFLHKDTCIITKFKKGLINIKNSNEKCFLCCHARHIDPVKTHPERIPREDKELVNNLNYEGLGSLFEKMILARFE